MRLERAEFEILQQLRLIPGFETGAYTVHLMLSGGKDSVALLEILHKLQTSPSTWSRVSFSLIVHHFNHKRRGAESDEEEQLCIDITRNVGCPLQIWRWNSELEASIEAGANFQARAREWRYSTVETFAKQQGQGTGSHWIIATAHHRRDHAETILHNIARGCGISGLRGLQPWSPTQQKLRPLLWLSTELCEQYIAHKRLPHREDSSNAQLDYTRNRIRHVVLKELEQLNPKTVEHIWNLSNDVNNVAEPSAEMSEVKSSDENNSRFVTLETIRSEQDLHRIIAQHQPSGRLELSREQLSNIFAHLKKCLNAPNLTRQYIFAVSEHLSVCLTNKHLEIKVTHPEFSNSQEPRRREL